MRSNGLDQVNHAILKSTIQILPVNPANYGLPNHLWIHVPHSARTPPNYLETFNQRSFYLET
jgi:hypothetical protein